MRLALAFELSGLCRGRAWGDIWGTGETLARGVGYASGLHMEEYSKRLGLELPSIWGCESRAGSRGIVETCSRNIEF